MSRVRKPGKFMNTSIYDSSITGPSKIIRTKAENADYHRCRTLTDWLFVKYDMDYKAFARKSKSRKDTLRKEFSEDTGLPEFRHIEKVKRKLKEATEFDWDD